MSTTRKQAKQAHAMKATSPPPPPQGTAGQLPKWSQPPVNSNFPLSPRRINGTDIVKEMRKRNSRKVETAILFFHPNIVTRPDSVSFKGVPGDILRFIDERCREFDALRKELNEQWSTTATLSSSVHDQMHNNSNDISISPPSFSPTHTASCSSNNSNSTSTAVIRTTEALIQYMISSSYPYTVDRPFLDCRRPDRFFYEPLLKLFYEVDDDAVVAIFPKLYKALYNNHFQTLGDIGPLRTRLCSLMHRLVGDFYGVEDLVAFAEKRTELHLMGYNNDNKAGHYSSLPSLYLLKSAGVRLELGDQLGIRPLSTAAEDEGEADTIVTIKPVTLYDLRYNYATFGRSNQNTHQYALPFVENPFALAFATAMARLAQLVPDEPSFNVAKDLGMITSDLWIDFVWWQDNVLKNAAYYQATQPCPWPPPTQQVTVTDKGIKALVDFYNLRTHPILSALGDEDPLNRTAVLFFHPNATRALDAICFEAVEARATALGQDTREFLCRQRRLDLLALLDSLEQALHIDDDESRTMVTVGDLCKALGLSDKNDSNNNSFFGLLGLFYTHPTTALHTLETTVSGVITKNPFIKMQKQLSLLIRHLIGDFYSALPKDYRFDGRTQQNEEPTDARNSNFHIPSLEQITTMSGWRVVIGDQIAVNREATTNTLVLKPLSLLNIRFRPDNFVRSAALEGYFADSMILLSMLVPDTPSFDRASQLGIIDAEHLMIDWSWWQQHVIEVAKYYVVDRHHLLSPPTAALAKQLEEIGDHDTHKQQEEAPPPSLPQLLPVLTEKKLVIADIKPVEVVDKETTCNVLRQTAHDVDNNDSDEKAHHTQAATTASIRDDALLALRFYYPDARKVPPLIDERQLQEQCRVNLLQLLVPWYPTDASRPAKCERKKRVLGHQYGSPLPAESTETASMDVVLRDYHDVFHYAKLSMPVKVSFNPALRHFDPTPMVQLFAQGGEMDSCFETLCLVHHWLNAVTPASEHLYYYDRLAQTLLGDFYGTLPCYYNANSLETTKEVHSNPKMEEIPNLEDWVRDGFQILVVVQQQQQHQQGRWPSISIDTERKRVSVCQVSMLDLRYNKPLTSSSLLTVPVTSSLLLLATLVPNQSSFRIAVETGMIPVTTVILDWSWWSRHVVAVAAAAINDDCGYSGVGKETYQLLCHMKDQYSHWKGQTGKSSVPSFIHRRWRDGVIGVLLLVILLLTLVQMIR